MLFDEFLDLRLCVHVSESKNQVLGMAPFEKMRNFVVLIALLCCFHAAAGAIYAESAVNLIPNGDFARGEIGNIPESWTVVIPNPALAPTFQLVEKDGKKMLMAQGNGRKECFGFVKAPFTMTKDKTYRLSVRFQIEGIDDVNRNLRHGFFGDRWADDNNGIFDYRREGDRIVGEHVFVARGEKREMRLYFRFSPNGKVWWEEVRLEECEPLAPRLVKIAVASGKRTLDAWKAFLDAAGEKKCDVALLPEFFVPGTHEPDGPLMKMMAEKAKQWKMHVSCSLLLKRGDVVYNSAPLFDREGHLLGIYDKVNLFEPELDEGTSPGESVPVFKTDFGTVGIMTCYDGWHPAVAKLLALKGAEVILYPNAGYYRQLVDARASDNGVVVAVSSQNDLCGVWDAGSNLGGGTSNYPNRLGPLQIVAFEESAEKNTHFVTVDLSVESSPAFAGGTMLSAPGGRRVRATGNFYLEDEISREVRRWETLPSVP
jgi:predicted amidohydrolase